MPVVAVMTGPELVHVTGLSSHYRWRVWAGRKRLHQMQWEKVLRFNRSRKKV